ncbi:MAG: PaaI family thioesterase [Sphingomonadales bacterium]|nr:PaaI family thioesterase [Sphingomonadales bacterium]MDE2568568.1 PaaI family thioesterase [Sphingomonadales bacterium]
MEESTARIAATLPPYARTMGMEIDRFEDGIPVLAYDFDKRVQGRPGFLHGGALGGLLEMAAHAALHAALDEKGWVVHFKPVNISIEYLRGGTPQRTYALGRIIRAGRRVANVRVDGWQADRDKPVASAWMNFLLKPREG